MSDEVSIKKDDDEISLIDLFAVLWHRKVMIITITAIAAVGAVVFSIISLVLPPEKSPLPNQYTPRSLMLIEGSSGGMSSMLGGMGGLAAMAGVSLPASASNSELAVYLAGTNSLLDSVVDTFGLITRYKIEKSPKASSRAALKKLLKASVDEKSGVLSISFTDTDPAFARDVVNYCTNYLAKRFDELGLDKNKIEKENLEHNIAATAQDLEGLEAESRKLEQSVAFGAAAGRLPAITTELNRISLELGVKRQVLTQLKVQYEMLKVTMSSEKPAFQVLELAEVPDRKSGPGRGMLCIIVTLAAGFFSVFLAFALNAVSNIKNDPEAMSKLRKPAKEERNKP